MTRLNKWLASATGLSRRAADAAITEDRVRINGQPVELGQTVSDTDEVTLDGEVLNLQDLDYIVLNKPTGYVCSRVGQGNDKTIYDLLPPELHHLKPVGRLDKDSCGLLLMTNDGDLANELTHPSYEKEKTYQVRLDKPLTSDDESQIKEGVQLEDGLSKLGLKGGGKNWTVFMHEGRNRQIRRTFDALGYIVHYLQRISFGKLTLGALEEGNFEHVTREEIQ